MLRAKIAKLKREIRQSQRIDVEPAKCARGASIRQRAACVHPAVEQPGHAAPNRPDQHLHRIDQPGHRPAATTPTTTAPSSAASGSTPSAGTGATAGAVFAIPVTIVSTGSAVDQLAFLKAIQVDGPRRALVISTALTPASGATTASIDASSTMTTQLSVFTAPLSSTAQAQLEKAAERQHHRLMIRDDSIPASAGDSPGRC